MTTRTDTPSPRDARSPHRSRLGRFAAGLALFGAATLAVSFVVPAAAQEAVLYAGFAALAVSAGLAVTHWLRRDGRRPTVVPTSAPGWLAAAMVVVGLAASVVGPLFDAGSRAASEAQNAAVRLGFTTAGLSGLVVLLAVWRRGERSLPTVVVCLLAGLAWLLVVLTLRFTPA